MEEMAGLITVQKEFEDGLADVHVKIERAVHELETVSRRDPAAAAMFEQAGRGPVALEYRATTGKTRT